MTGGPDTTVTWDVNGVVGGNPTVGLILNSQTAPDNTTYTAPQSLPAGGSVTVHARGMAHMVPRIVNAAEEAHAEILDLGVAEPSLETVFINLTGKELRD